jgi:hypothetical protein
MSICFYSTNHLGDILFSNPFIKKICDDNPSKQFYQWSLYGNELVCGPSNLHYLKIQNCDNYSNNFVSGLAPEDFISNDYLKQLFIENHHTSVFHFKYEENDYIGLNTWCIALGCSEDVNLMQLRSCYTNKIREINQNFNTDFKLTEYNNWDLIPCLKDAPINTFMNWYDTIDRNTKLIFIYNYVPRLVHLSFDMNNFIRHICNSYKSNIIIVPLYNDLLKDIPNIKFCDKDFECENVISGKNLLMINKINYMCDSIIALPTGASWCWFNINFKDRPKKIYMLDDNGYVNRINKWYAYATNDKNIVHSLNLNNLNLISF